MRGVSVEPLGEHDRYSWAPWTVNYLMPFTWVVVEVWAEYQQMLPTGIDIYEDTWHYSFLSEEGLVFSHGGSVYSFPPFSPQHVLNVFTACFN